MVVGELKRVDERRVLPGARRSLNFASPFSFSLARASLSARTHAPPPLLACPLTRFVPRTPC